MASPAVANNFCPKCGVAVASDDHFCRSCGAAVGNIPTLTPVSVGISASESKEQNKDKLLGVRIVLLVAAGISAFILPWPVAAFLGLCWVITLVLPK